MDIISSYTRREALEDGFQVEMTEELASIWRNYFKWPVYMTSAVWALVEKADADNRNAASTEGIVHDIAHMTYFAMRKKPQGGRGLEVVVRIPQGRRNRIRRFWVEAGPVDIDNPAPCLTVMLPSER